MSRQFAIIGIVVVLGLLGVGGAIVVSGTTPHRDDEIRTPDAPTSRSDGVQRESGDESPTPSDDKTDEPAKPESLLPAFLAMSAPPESTWFLQSFGQAQVPKDMLWVRGVIDRTVLGASMPEPPYFPEFMLAPADRPWLEQFERLFETEARRLGDAATPAERDAALELLRAEFRQRLLEAARHRYLMSSDRSKFDDATMLRDMESGTDSYRWLDRMLDRLAPTDLWVGQELNDPSDRNLLSAADLPVLARLRQRVREVYDRAGPRPVTREEFRDIAVEFNDLVSSRRDGR